MLCDWVRLSAVANVLISTHYQVCSSMGVNTVGNILSAEKRCNYPGRSRVTLGIASNLSHIYSSLLGSAPLSCTFLDVSPTFDIFEWNLAPYHQYPPPPSPLLPVFCCGWTGRIPSQPVNQQGKPGKSFTFSIRGKIAFEKMARLKRKWPVTVID